MKEIRCNGLPANWVNAWLAAVGATALDSRVHLRWTTDSTPRAVLSAAQIDPLEALLESWPSEDQVQDLPIAYGWRDGGPFERRIPVEQFVKRVRAARNHPSSWVLSSTVTDLYVDNKGFVAHAPFDPPGPGPTKWLHHRFAKLHKGVSVEAKCFRDSLTGRAERVRNNGLGFDLTRIGGLSDASNVWVDPVVECLAFYGLSILPVRGEGIDERLQRGGGRRPERRQRGWRKMKRKTGPRPQRFTWPAWSQPLDSVAIDALLDVWIPEKKQSWQLWGVHAGWRSVKYESRGSADSTRAYGSERI